MVQKIFFLKRSRLIGLLAGVFFMPVAALSQVQETRGEEAHGESQIETSELLKKEIVEDSSSFVQPVVAENVRQAEAEKVKNEWPWLRSDRMAALARGEGEADGVILLAAWLTGVAEAEKAAGRSCPPNDRVALDKIVVAALDSAPADAPAAAVAGMAIMKSFPCEKTKQTKKPKKN